MRMILAIHNVIDKSFSLSIILIPCCFTLSVIDQLGKAGGHIPERAPTLLVHPKVAKENPKRERKSEIFS